MRLRSLTIRSKWKNLEGLQVTFDAKKTVTVFIGQNGSAKSNLLEAIITILRDIDLSLPASFSFEFSYYIYGHEITISADQNSQPRALLDKQSTSISTIRDRYLPKHVIGYYSGVSDRFDSLFREYDLKARAATLVPSHTPGKPEDRLQLRRFICARPVHGLFALLAFYYANDKGVTEFLRELPRITGFDSALLSIKKPKWAKKGKTAEDFWGALGPVRDLLVQIKKYSLAPFSYRARVKLDFAHYETRELIYLYLQDLEALRSVAAVYGQDPRVFFQALDTMRLSDLIEDFRVRVHVVGSTGAIHTRQLSEGEQQLLTVLGLMRFTRDESSLYILDEPDTHLNPAWGIEYLEQLRRIGGIHSESHTLLATHDPLLVAGLCKEEIRILSRNDDGKIRAEEPDESPRGMGLANVITSPLYGLESQLDSFSLRVLKRIYEIATTTQKNPERTKHLEKLKKLVPALSLLDTLPDPYRNIAREAYKLAQSRVLSSDDNPEKKRQIIEQLATMLFNEALEKAK